MGLLGYLLATAVRLLLSLAFWGAVGLSIMGLYPDAAVQEKVRQTVGTKTAQDILNAAQYLASMLRHVNSYLAVYTAPVCEAVMTWLNEKPSSKKNQTWSKRRKGKASRHGGDEKEWGEEGEARAPQAKSTAGGSAKARKEIVDKRADRGSSAQPRADAAAGAVPRQRGVIGTTVEARYHGSGEWLRATIVGVLQGTQGGFRVQYTDGEREELTSQWVRTPGYKSFVGAVVQETYRSSDNDEESESEEPSEDEGSKSSWLAAGARVAAAHMAASYDFDGGATDDGWQLVNPTRTISKPRPSCPASSSTLPMPACESSSSAYASWTRPAKPRSSASRAPTSVVDATLKNRKKREKKREKELMVRTLKQLHGSA